MTASRSTTPPVASRALGVVGMLGGLGLLAAFVMDIPGALNTFRLVLFCGGAISTGVALFGPHAAASRRLALAATAPLVVANAMDIAWILLAVGRERPFAGDFGLLGFWAGLAVWLAGAWFGIVALRLGAAWRPAALILAVGSLMAITGMDRLELTSRANPTIFVQISLLGIAMVGTAWVLLGAQIAIGRAQPRGTAVDVFHQSVHA